MNDGVHGNPTAVITGAANGIGRAIAREYARRGLGLALLDRDEAALRSTTETLPESTAYACDVRDEASVTRAREEVEATGADVRVVVCNAGISVAGPVEQLPIDEIRRAMDVNFWGVVHVSRAFLPALRASARRHGRASLAVVLSDFALFSLPTKAAYAASKHAARACTEALGAELHGSGVVVTAAYPGATATGIVRSGYAVDPTKQRTESDFLAGGMTAEAVAARIVRGIDRGKARVLVGRDTRAIDLATRLAPGLVQFAVRRLWRRVPFL